MISGALQRRGPVSRPMPRDSRCSTTSRIERANRRSRMESGVLPSRLNSATVHGAQRRVVILRSLTGLASLSTGAEVITSGPSFGKPVATRQAGSSATPFWVVWQALAPAYPGTWTSYFHRRSPGRRSDRAGCNHGVLTRPRDRTISWTPAVILFATAFMASADFGQKRRGSRVQVQSKPPYWVRARR
jgi:hypothetical protein